MYELEGWAVCDLEGWAVYEKFKYVVGTAPHLRRAEFVPAPGAPLGETVPAEYAPRQISFALLKPSIAGQPS